MATSTMEPMGSIPIGPTVHICRDYCDYCKAEVDMIWTHGPLALGVITVTIGRSTGLTSSSV